MSAVVEKITSLIESRSSSLNTEAARKALEVRLNEQYAGQANVRLDWVDGNLEIYVTEA